jgi:hypothetical protein
VQLRPEGQGQCDRPQVDHPPEDPGRFTIGDEFGCPGLRFFGERVTPHPYDTQELCGLLSRSPIGRVEDASHEMHTGITLPRLLGGGGRS